MTQQDRIERVLRIWLYLNRASLFHPGPDKRRQCLFTDEYRMWEEMTDGSRAEAHRLVNEERKKAGQA